MDTITPIWLGIVLFGCGTALTLLLLSSLWRPVSSLFRKVKSVGSVRNSNKQMVEIDALLDGQDYSKALIVLRQMALANAVYAETQQVFFSRSHQNILSRCLIVADELGITLGNLDTVERQLAVRSELLVLLGRTEEAYDRFLTRRERDRKDAPKWTKDQFLSKINDIKANMDANSKDLTHEWTVLFSTLEAQVLGRGRTIH